MSTFLRRTLYTVLSLIVILAALVAVGGPIVARRSFPQTEGEINLPGLQAPVDIYRDEFGIPQIYASTRHDLFFAEGYVHAQDRFWQMDVWRHTGSGSLAEMFGDAQVKTDAFLRTLGWARVVEQELQTLDPESLAILDAYAEGVNAYLADHKGSKLSLEYAILGLLTPDYQPEPWTPLNSLTWAKAMAWDLRGNMDNEIQRAILLKTLPLERVEELFPPYPEDHPVIVPNPYIATAGGVNPVDYPGLLSEVFPAMQSIASQFANLDALLGAAGDGIGSNNWVISGDRTASGLPLLANDPHLSQQIPSIWYEVGLHCTPKGPDCPFEVTGFSFAGLPAVVVGHNERIAWGVTNVGPDVMDLYIEKINPANPNQYEFNGEWVDMDLVKETIKVGGGEPVELTVRYTRHGPIISDTYGSLEGFDEKVGIELPSNFAIALRWTALEPGMTLRAFLGFDLAQNWDEFRAAARDFTVPSQNLIYADVDGNIGYQTPGRIPIRANGDGRYPAPGWTDEFEWTGYIPFEDLPFAFNPPEGYIATANNAVVGPEYPYMISREWAYGYRAQSIVDMIENAPAPITIAYIQKMQGDNRNLNAETLVPFLLQLPPATPQIAAALSLLKNWDYQQHMDQAAPAVFEVFWRHLLAATFQDELPEKYWPGGNSRWFEVVRILVNEPDSPWWDNQTTATVENRDAIFSQALAGAVDELESSLGKDPQKWTWGDLHTLTLRHQTLGSSGIGPIEAIFNRGEYRTSGGSGIVNATGWNAASKADNPYQVLSLPSFRMIVDFSDLSNSIAMHTTGQSGHAYHPHYVDMADHWRLIEYHPQLWARPDVESAAEAHLKLTP